MPSFLLRFLAKASSILLVLFLLLTPFVFNSISVYSENTAQTSTTGAEGLKPPTCTESGGLMGVLCQVRDWIFGFLLSMLYYVLGVVVWILQLLSGLIFTLLAKVTQFALTINPASDTWIDIFRSPFSAMVSIANIFIILSFVWAGFSKITGFGGMQKASLEDFLTKTAITALLINFSFYAVAAFISLMYEIGAFFQAVMASALSSPNQGAIFINFSDAIKNSGDIISANQKIIDDAASKSGSNNGDSTNGLSFLLQQLSLLVVYIFGIGAMWKMLTMLLKRVLILGFMMVIAPVGIVMLFSPIKSLQSYGEGWLKEIWTKSIIYPVIVIGLFLGASIVTKTTDVVKNLNTGTEGEQLKSVIGTDGVLFVQFMIPALMAVMILTVLHSFLEEHATGASDKMFKAVKGLAKTGSDVAFKGVVGGAGVVGGIGAGVVGGMKTGSSTGNKVGDWVSSKMGNGKTGALVGGLVGGLAGGVTAVGSSIGKGTYGAYSGGRFGLNTGELVKNRFSTGVKNWAKLDNETDRKIAGTYTDYYTRKLLGNQAADLMNPNSAFRGMDKSQLQWSPKDNTLLKSEATASRLEALNSLGGKLSLSGNQMLGSLKTLQNRYVSSDGQVKIGDLSTNTSDLKLITEAMQKGDRDLIDAIKQDPKLNSFFGSDELQKYFYEQDRESYSKFYAISNAGLSLANPGIKTGAGESYKDGMIREAIKNPKDINRKLFEDVNFRKDFQRVHGSDTYDLHNFGRDTGMGGAVAMTLGSENMADLANEYSQYSGNISKFTGEIFTKGFDRTVNQNISRRISSKMDPSEAVFGEKVFDDKYGITLDKTGENLVNIVNTSNNVEDIVKSQAISVDYSKMASKMGISVDDKTKAMMDKLAATMMSSMVKGNYVGFASESVEQSMDRGKQTNEILLGIAEKLSNNQGIQTQSLGNQGAVVAAEQLSLFDNNKSSKKSSDLKAKIDNTPDYNRGNSFGYSGYNPNSSSSSVSQNNIQTQVNGLSSDAIKTAVSEAMKSNQSGNIGNNYSKPVQSSTTNIINKTEGDTHVHQTNQYNNQSGDLNKLAGMMKRVESKIEKSNMMNEVVVDDVLEKQKEASKNKGNKKPE